MKGIINTSSNSSATTVLFVIAPINSTVTIKKNSITQIQNSIKSILVQGDSTKSIYKFKIGSFGTWQVTAELNGGSSTREITILQPGAYSISVDIIWGAYWTKTSSSAFIRTNDASNFSDPEPAKGTATGHSPFDNIAPWSQIKEFNIVNNQIAYEKGVDPEFSRTDYDTVVRIPKFWYKITNFPWAWSVQISNTALSGFSLHPAFTYSDYIYVGKYIAGTGYVSKSGMTQIGNVTRANFRTNAMAKGDGAHWDCINIATLSAIQLLYLVEFANWNSQNKIGKGCAFAGVAVNTGGTDIMQYHTGYPVGGTDGQINVQYRWIEDLWGLAQTWIVGLNFSSSKPYFCLDRSKFIDSGTTNYTALSFNVPTTSGNLVTNIGYDSTNPWIILPSSTSTSTDTTTYITDYWWGGSSGVTLQAGSGYSNEDRAGLFSYSGDNVVSYTAASRGGRLIYIPS